MSSVPILEVEGLTKTFALGRLSLPWTQSVRITAVDRVTLSLRRGEILGIAGESGSGKTTVGRCIVGLEQPTAGCIRVGGKSFADSEEQDFRRLRRKLQMVFQDPRSSLNPRMVVGEIVDEPLRLLTNLTAASRRLRVREILSQVGLPQDAVSRYRHQLSGGEQQRVSIARALIVHPDIVVLDEPVSALDASVRTQVLSLLMDLHDSYNLSYIYISHDLQTVKAMCERVLVMFRGRIVESGRVSDVFQRPKHPYTRRLLSASLLPGVQRAKLDGTEGWPESAEDAASLEQVAWHNSPYDLIELETGHFVALTGSVVD